MGAYSPRSGKGSRVITNGQTLLCMDTANVNEKGDDLDTTTFN